MATKKTVTKKKKIKDILRDICQEINMYVAENDNISELICIEKERENLKRK